MKQKPLEITHIFVIIFISLDPISFFMLDLHPHKKRQ